MLFVAIVSYNQAQSARNSDVALAQSLAEAASNGATPTSSKAPLGADWRPPFRAINMGTFSADRDTWPIHPVMGPLGANYGVFGADIAEDTEDDYYSDFERARGWHGEVDAGGAYIRRGFRIPDVNATPGNVTSQRGRSAPETAISWSA